MIKEKATEKQKKVREISAIQFGDEKKKNLLGIFFAIGYRSRMKRKHYAAGRTAESFLYFFCFAQFSLVGPIQSRWWTKSRAHSRCRGMQATNKQNNKKQNREYFICFCF